jgi:hypothetical protein
MTVSSIAPATAADALALALAAESDRWVRGYRKSDGLAFWAIPGSNGHVYNTTSAHCTCPSAQNRPGPCKHSRAVALVEQREAERLGLAPIGALDVEIAFADVASKRRRPLVSYAELYGDDDI